MLEYLQGRLLVALEGLGVDALGLDSLHQGLGHRVVLAAAGAAHGGPLAGPLGLVGLKPAGVGHAGRPGQEAVDHFVGERTGVGHLLEQPLDVQAQVQAVGEDGGHHAVDGGRCVSAARRVAKIYLPKPLAAALDGGPCADLEGYPLLPYGLLEEHVDRLGRAYAELREELRRVVPRLPLHAYGDVDRLHVDLPASCVRNTAIVRAAGDMFPESVMA